MGRGVSSGGRLLAGRGFSRAGISRTGLKDMMYSEDQGCGSESAWIRILILPPGSGPDSGCK